MSLSEFLNFMCDEKHPVITPFRTAVYSDGGFSILGQVIQRISGQSYGDAMQDILFKPLGLNGMSAKAPTSSGLNAINRKTIDNTSSWGLDIDIVAS
jgi:CubicO group peptidase (beta-lactamase class C family)